MRKILLIALVTLICFIAACSDTGQSEAPGSVPEVSLNTAPETTSENEREAASQPQYEGPAPDVITGTIEMEDGGIITFELYPDIAPQSVRNFVELARSGFYDGTRFHRIISGMMIQGGCPDGSGGGNPGYSIVGEFNANDHENNLKHTRGVLSMARGPDYNSAGSQFFIMHDVYPSLDNLYAGFGMVTSGMDVVDKIAATPNSGNNGRVAPENMPVIKSITIDGNFALEGADKLSR